MDPYNQQRQASAFPSLPTSKQTLHSPDTDPNSKAALSAALKYRLKAISPALKQFPDMRSYTRVIK